MWNEQQTEKDFVFKIEKKLNQNERWRFDAQNWHYWNDIDNFEGTDFSSICYVLSSNRTVFLKCEKWPADRKGFYLKNSKVCLFK